jgi:hypothetical protein
MQLEGLTRGFDTTASDAVAKVIAAEAKVPQGSVEFVNVRTVSGFATYYVSDCRRTDCVGGRRLQAATPAGGGATAIAFEVAISSNDGAVSNVLTLLSDLSSASGDEVLNASATYSSHHFAARLAGELSEGYGEDVSVAVRATNVSTSDAVETGEGFIPWSPIPSSPVPPTPPPPLPVPAQPQPATWPPLPPDAVVTLVPQVVITLVAAGTVEDYDDDARTGLIEAFAAESGVPPEDVTLTIEPASVLIRFVVDLPSEAASAQLKAALATSMADASAASSLLSIAVESTPLVAAVVTRIILQPPLSPPAAPPTPSQEGGGSILLGAAAGGGGGLLVVLLVMWCCFRRYGGKRDCEVSMPSVTTSSAASSVSATSSCSV